MRPSTGGRLIVFDLDGTLVDSRRDLAESANAILRASGCRTLAEKVIGRMVGDGAALLVARAFEAAGSQAPPGALDEFLALYNERLLKHTRAYPGIPSVLEMLAARATLAVLTNKPLAPAQAILDGLQLAPFFSRVVGGDGPHPRKPDPTGLLDLAEQAGASVEQTILVGDSMVDWRTARAAGTRICVARYGFGFEGVAEADLPAADFSVSHPSELSRLG